jgi:hypothetical protein
LTPIGWRAEDRCLTDAELGLWVRLLAASARRGDPNTGRAALQVLRLTSRRLARFVEIGLLEVVDGGYVVSGWDGYFPKDSTAAERKRRSGERAGARGPPPST